MRTLKFIGISLAVALLLSGFILVNNMSRYIFSIGGLLLSIYYFRQNPTWPIRIAFILVTVVLAMLLPVIYVAYAYEYGWPIDPRFLEGLPPKN